MKNKIFALLLFIVVNGVSNAKNLKLNDKKVDNIDIKTNFYGASIIENETNNVTVAIDCDMYAVNVIEDCYLCDDFLSDVGYIYLFRTIVEDCYRQSCQ